MAVVASDLLQPRGELFASLFAGDDETAVAQRLGEYITQGAEIAATLPSGVRDRMTAAYAYMRAYGYVVVRLSNRPAMASQEGEGSETYAKWQIDALAGERDKWAGIVDGFVYADASASAVLPATTPSSVRVQFRF